MCDEHFGTSDEKRVTVPLICPLFHSEQDHKSTISCNYIQTELLKFTPGKHLRIKLKETKKKKAPKTQAERGLMQVVKIYILLVMVCVATYQQHHKALKSNDLQYCS